MIVEQPALDEALPASAVVPSRAGRFSWPRPADALAPSPWPPAARTKVLHVITKFYAGAGGNTLLSVLGADPARWEEWVAGSEGGPLWERAERAGVRVVRLARFQEVVAPIDDVYVLWQLIRLIRRERFAVVHTHSSKGGFLGRIAARVCRTPVVVHTHHGFAFHEHMSRVRYGMYLGLERLVGPLTDAFLAVAPLVAEEAVERRIARAKATRVVPSAVELAAIPAAPDPGVRAELGIAAGAALIGTVGRIEFQKAPLDFVRMAAIVARRRPDARFVMVGDGPLTADVRAEAARLGVDILLTGFRPDAPRLAAAFDVFVISSLYEGLGRAVTEAAAAGCPIVATAVNGVPDLVASGRTGLLVPPVQPEAAASAVLWMLDHPERARRMGADAQAFVRDEFRAEIMCGLIDQTYCRLLEHAGRRRRVIR